ncbi:MAG: LapA family protein [Cyanobacteria bacterium P01_A01_bin.17]
MRTSLIQSLIIALLAIIFAFQNPVVLVIRFGIWAVQASLAFILLFTLAVGFLVGLLVSMPAILKRGWKSSKRKHTIQELEQELHQQTQLAADQKRRIEFLEQNLPQGTER